MNPLLFQLLSGSKNFRVKFCLHTTKAGTHETYGVLKLLRTKKREKIRINRIPLSRPCASSTPGGGEGNQK